MESILKEHQPGLDAPESGNNQQADITASDTNLHKTTEEKNPGRDSLPQKTTSPTPRRDSAAPPIIRPTPEPPESDGIFQPINYARRLWNYNPTKNVDSVNS